MNECLFCKLANANDNLVWQNDWAAAFKDIHPKAPVHILIVPKKHVRSLDDLNDVELAGHLLLAVKEVAQAVGVSGNYRVAINVGRPAGQIIDHLHLHLLGPRPDQSYATGGAEVDQAAELA
jgi:histidine triad (HIT) family protein